MTWNVDSPAVRLRIGGALILAVLTLGALVLPAPSPAQEATEEPLLITLEADSTAVTDILQILAAKSGFNIVTSAEVYGRAISIRLGETPFEEALNLVVRASGLGYERIGNSILVADPNRLATQTGLTTRVFTLEYADPHDVRDAVTVITQSASVNPKSNQVVVRDSQALVEQAAEIVAEMDRKPGQVMLEARLIEVNLNDLSELGIDWERITKTSTVITEGNPGTSPQGVIPDELGYTVFDDGTDFHRQLPAFEVALDALITNGHARLLTHSKVAAVENAAAELFVGETVPVVVTSLGSASGTAGTFQTIQLEKIDVGIKLNITPRISGDGFITTEVEPEVSQITAFVGPDSDLPQTSTRRAKTVVRVRDGQKIYLGGLISETDRRTIKRVPVLGYIPVLGALFSHHRIEKVRMDLVIEITPTIVGDEGSASNIEPEMEEE